MAVDLSAARRRLSKIVEECPTERAAVVDMSTIADRINAEHQACEQAARSALEHARAAGGLLQEAKETLPHGQWESWIEDSCAFSARTARMYMQVARHWPELEERQRVAVLSLREAVKLLSTPRREEEDGESQGAAQQDVVNANEIERLLACGEDERARELGKRWSAACYETVESAQPTVDGFRSLLRLQNEGERLVLASKCAKLRAEQNFRQIVERCPAALEHLKKTIPPEERDSFFKTLRRMGFAE